MHDRLLPQNPRLLSLFGAVHVDHGNLINKMVPIVVRNASITGGRFAWPLFRLVR